MTFRPTGGTERACPSHAWDARPFNSNKWTGAWRSQRGPTKVKARDRISCQALSGRGRLSPKLRITSSSVAHLKGIVGNRRALFWTRFVTRKGNVGKRREVLGVVGRRRASSRDGQGRAAESSSRTSDLLNTISAVCARRERSPFGPNTSLFREWYSSNKCALIEVIASSRKLPGSRVSLADRKCLPGRVV